MEPNGARQAPNLRANHLLQIATIVACSVLGGLVLLDLTGCSIIGWRIGANSDAKKPDSLMVQSWQLETVHNGRKLVLYLVDGSVVTGTLQRVVQDSTPPYEERYASFAATLTAPTGFPAPGDSVTLRKDRGTRTRARLIGYDFDRIVVQPEAGPPVTVLSKDANRIEWRDQPIAAFPLMSWLQYSRVPLLSSLVIKQSDQDASAATTSGSSAVSRASPKAGKTVERHVPVSDVRQIQCANIKHGARDGFIIGLAIDAVIVVVALVAMNDEPESPPPPPPPPSGGEGSCPLIYSFDGRTHILDAEAFSGAILEKLQQADYASLDHLRAIDGVCRIRVANHLPETHYVDQLQLIAVDHPRGVRVLPEGPARWRTIADPQRPVAVIDDAGSVVTRLVADRDSRYWISSPLRRGPAEGGSLRDGLDLRFARPSHADRVKLVLTLRNTPWLTELEQRLLELPGMMHGLWSAQMNASATDRRLLTDALQRELGLRAELWDGTAWRHVGDLPFVGPFVSRSIVLPVDLATVRSEEVRIRIESAPGMWMIDCVEADFGEDLPVSASSLAADKATDEMGRDVRGRIASVDRDHLRLESGDEANVEFRVEPPRPGLERSYVVLCNGYYTIHVAARGLPQLALMRRLAREPGAGRAYATGVVNRWIARELPPTLEAMPGEQN
jgi:hypothetical protein